MCIMLHSQLQLTPDNNLADACQWQLRHVALGHVVRSVLEPEVAKLIAYKAI